VFDGKSSISVIALLACYALLLVDCGVIQKGQDISEGELVPASLGPVVNLEQGWTADIQQAFYFTTQGSRIMPYGWFLVLEQANNSELFRNDKHIEALRYLPAEANSWNPDGLPVGFAKDIDYNKESWIGLTCAACHTTQIDYQGKRIRIDGGPTLGDFETFNQSLVEALIATYEDQFKFARFAKSILGADVSNASIRNKLRDDLLAQTEALAYRNEINHSGGADQPHYGFGRLDAIGAIFNKIMVQINDMPANIRPSDAPASYPFLWGTHQSDVVQWTGFAPNGPATVGALTRNGGEVLGVYGAVNIPENKYAKSYKSSLAIKKLGQLEAWVAILKSPAWPAEYLPPVNPDKAAQGKIHYDRYCLGCHQVIPRDQEGEPYTAVLTPISELKTDPTEWVNMQRLLQAGKFEGRKEAVIAGAKIAAETTGLEPLVNSVIGSLLRHPVKSVEAIVTQIEGGYAARQQDKKAQSPNLEDKVKAYSEMFTLKQIAVPEGGVYKARPLNGIWATAPYLHNGSVPNLYELLLPQEKRSKTFFLGSREFDALRVGFVSTEQVSGTQAFKFDTTLKGNSNKGHTYGTNEITASERLELLEYLKTL
jgi:processive rubber oxygenase RoxA-like protein